MDGVDGELVPWDTTATVDGLPQRRVGTVQISADVSELGQPVTIEIPPADQVTPADELNSMDNASALLPTEVRAELCAGWEAPPADEAGGVPDTLPLGGEDPFGEVADLFTEMCAGLAATPPG